MTTDLCEGSAGKYCVEHGESCEDGSRPSGGAIGNSFCRGQTRACPIFDVSVVPTPVDGGCMVVSTIPPKGGSNTDVGSSDPLCGSGSSDVARCQFVQVRPPDGNWDIGNVQYLAKEFSTASTCYDPQNYLPCNRSTTDRFHRQTGICQVEYSRWVDVEERNYSASATFLNWSHDRPRCMAIRYEVRRRGP